MIEVECNYAECFVPPERHGTCAAASISKCWGKLGHQHTPKRSQGGVRCHVMLCQGHSDNIDNGTRYEGLRLRDRVVMGVYFIENRDTGAVLREIPVAA